MKRPFLMLMLLALAGASWVGCTPSRSTPAAEIGWELDTSRAASAKIPASAGGAIAATDAAGNTGEVRFPAGSLATDTDVEVVPIARAKPRDASTVVDGIVVRKKGDPAILGHLPLLKPAVVRFVVKGSAAEDLTIVRYSDDGASFAPVATSTTPVPGGMELVAQVDSFSPYGASRSKAPPRDDRVLRVNHTMSVPANGFNVEYHLVYHGVTGRGASGAYRGRATMSQTGTLANPPSRTEGNMTGSMDLTLTVGPADGAITGSGTFKAAGTAKVIVLGKVREERPANLGVGVKVSGKVPEVILDLESIGRFRGTLGAPPKQEECDVDKLAPNRQNIMKANPAVLAVRGQSFTSLGDAQAAAIGSIRGICGTSSSEWGGMTCKDENGRFHVVPGGMNHCGTDFEGEIDTGVAAGCPDPSMVPVANYHCHPSGSQKMSEGDVDIAKEYGLDGADVLLPSGKVEHYPPPAPNAPATTPPKTPRPVITAGPLR